MSKIAIVGVEGSGKTTLMAAFGEKYMTPDANGYSLDPQEFSTFPFVSSCFAPESGRISAKVRRWVVGAGLAALVLVFVLWLFFGPPI